MSRHAPYLQRRGFGLTFRIAVPSDLREIVGGRELTKAIPTLDKRIAVPLALECAATAKRMFGTIRAAMFMPPDDEEQRQPMDPDKLREAVREARHRIQIADLKEQRFEESFEERREHLRELQAVKLKAENELQEVRLKAEKKRYEAFWRALVPYPC